MGSNFMKSMENYQGDLVDIFRSPGGGGNTAPEVATNPEWIFPSNNPISYSSDPSEDFGDPFTNFRDPLLQDISTPNMGGFFHSSNIVKSGVEVTGNAGGFASGGEDNNGSINRNTIFDDEMKRPSNNIFSRMLQISPNAKLPVPPCDSPTMAAVVASPRGLKVPPMLVPSHDHSLISPNSSKAGCLLESPSLQISSPRNTGIKRRKSQAKKVVCIPAPAPANSRAGGEVVPSDLWAWRKYGQKPIKGSPYPRGYYRCSSSKGCSARKQVERSRTDPNMLVITYTSEHNHPWPTQRNALAGSTRSQPTKNSCSSTTPAAKNSPPKSTSPKEEPKEISKENPVVVKEEMDQQLEMDDAHAFDDRGYPQSYKPALPDSSHSEDSFFAELGEIEADPLHLIFAQGFSGDGGRESKSLDPFSFYDWPGSNSNSNAAASTTTSYGGANKKDS